MTKTHLLVIINRSLLGLILLTSSMTVNAALKAIEDSITILAPLSIDEANLQQLAENHQPLLEIIPELLEEHLQRGFYDDGSFRSNRVIYSREYGNREGSTLRVYSSAEERILDVQKIIENAKEMNANTLIIPAVKSVFKDDFYIIIDSYNLNSSPIDRPASDRYIISTDDGLLGLEKQVSDAAQKIILNLNAGYTSMWKTTSVDGNGESAVRASRTFQVSCFRGTGGLTGYQESLVRRFTLELPGVLARLAESMNLNFRFRGLSLTDYVDSCLRLSTNDSAMTAQQSRPEKALFFDYEIFGDIVFDGEQALLTTFVFSLEKSANEARTTDVLLEDIPFHINGKEWNIDSVAKDMMEKLSVLDLGESIR